MGKAELAQRLLAIGESVQFVLSNEAPTEEDEYFRWLSNEGSTLWATYNDMAEFEAIVDEFCSGYADLGETCSRAYVADYLENLVWQAAKPSGTVSEADVAATAKAIRDKPVETHRVIRAVEGLVLEGDPLAIGTCRLLRLPDHLSLVQHGFPLAIPGNNLLGTATTIAMTDVQARDMHKAEELADELLFHLDATLRYLLLRVGGDENFGIFSSKNPVSKEAQILTPSKSSISWGMVHPAKKVVFRGDDLEDHQELGPLLAAMLDASPNDIQGRIRSAVRWASAAIAAADEATSMAQFMFGVEAIFSSRSEPIGPSIMERISSSVAWLISANPNSRLDAARRMKRIYGQRSAIVHGGTFNVDHRDLTFLEQALRRTIKSILIWETLSDIRNQDELGAAIRKWSFGNLNPPPGDL